MSVFAYGPARLVHLSCGARLAINGFYKGLLSPSLLAATVGRGRGGATEDPQTPLVDLTVSDWRSANATLVAARVFTPVNSPSARRSRPRPAVAALEGRYRP